MVDTLEKTEVKQPVPSALPSAPQENLFGNRLDLTDDDLKGRFSSNFVLWWTGLDENSRKTAINLTIRANLANSAPDALYFLDAQASVVDTSRADLKHCDFTTIDLGQSWKRISKQVDEPVKNSRVSVHRTHGTLQHSLMQDLSALKEVYSSAILNTQALYHPRQNDGQLPLWDHLSQTDDFSPEMFDEIKGLADQIALNRRIAEADPFLCRRLNLPLSQRLARLLTTFVGAEKINRLWQIEGDIGSLRASDSFASVARAVLFAQDKGHWPFLSEVLIKPAGRADALEPLDECGHPIKGLELDALRRAGIKPHSEIGTITLKLLELYGQPSFSILDWKMANGDAEDPYSAIEIEEIQDQPIPSHQTQIKRYNTWGTWGVYQALHETGIYNGDHWTQISAINSAELIYFTPDGVIRHEVEVTPKDRQEIFDQYTHRLLTAQRNSRRRFLNTALASIISGRLRGQNRRIQGFNLPLPSEQMQPEPHPIVKLLKENQTFLDQNQVILEMGEGQRGLILSNLTAALAEGRVIADPKFNLETGGFIQCLNPDHEDHNPSMQINIRRGFFHCYTCKCNGELVEDPNSPNQTITFNSPGLTKKEWWKIAEIVVPDEHDKHMRSAQNFLQYGFMGNNEAQNYLIRRGIDPDLALSLGAGFGNINFVNFMLDSGYTFNDLIHYGWIGFTSDVNGNWGYGLPALLKKRGFSMDEITRPRTGRDSKEILQGMPFFRMSNRVTFPTFIYDNHSNFYGRHISAESKRLYHRKLSVDETHLEPGMFNSDYLKNSDGRIYIAEGVFDALSLIQNGYPAVGFVGAINHLHLDWIAQSNVDVYLGLDADKNKHQTGQTRTIDSIAELTELFKKYHSNRQVIDFTTQVRMQYPEWDNYDCKDFNDFMVVQLALSHGSRGNTVKEHRQFLAKLNPKKIKWPRGDYFLL